MEATQQAEAADALAVHQEGAKVYGEKISLEELQQIPTPPATETFSPLSHGDFVKLIESVSDKVLRPQGYQIGDLQLTVAKEGQQLFGAMTFDKDRDDLKLSLSFRQSMDKSMAAAIAIGGRVTICYNMMIIGKEVVFRKHTGDVTKALKDKIVLTLFDVDDAYTGLQEDQARMVNVPMADDPAFGAFGVAYAHGILTSTQLSRAVQEWKEPTFDHGAKSAWSWYNTITQVYKGLPLATTMKRHRLLHDFARTKILSGEQGLAL